MPNPSGLCLCGCGQKTPIATHTIKKRGQVRGEPCNYIHGHYSRDASPPIEVDRGYSTPCHIYQGHIDKLGYPRREAKTGTVLVHRQIYISAHGEIPQGLDVHHLCEQRDCIRLEHLEFWTRSQHIRSHRGITPEKYEEICAALRSGESSQAAIARRFGVSKSYIWELRRSLLA